MKERDEECINREPACHALLRSPRAYHPTFALTCFLILIFISPLFFQITSAGAADPKRKLKSVKQKLKKEEAKVKIAIKKEKSLLTKLDTINRTIMKKKSEISLYDKQIKETTSKINSLKKDISLLTGKMGRKKSHLKERLRELYKQQLGGDIALILFSSKDYQNLLKRSRYISLLAYYDSRLMKKYSKGIRNYSFKKQQMEMLQKDLRENKKRVRKKMQEMSSERAKKDKLLASIKSKRSSYEKMVKELKGASVRLQKMVTDLEKKKKAASLAGKGFTALRGRLPWPVKGRIIVPFGKYKDPKFNIPVFKNGIEIEAATGGTVNAVHGGRVVFADWFKGYGQLLIINHEKGYHSLYGNLSEIFYKSGDIIKRNAAVGKISEPEALKVSTLYFEIRYKGKPLDPAGWLKRKRIAEKRKSKSSKK